MAVLLAAAVSFGWERVNTGTIYFIDDSTTISENLEPAKKISINGQQNFAAGEEAKWKAAPATNVVVENGVSIKSEVFNNFTKEYVGGSIQIGKTNLTLKGNNEIYGGELWFSDDGASFNAENATINLTGDNGLCVDSNVNVVLKGGTLNSNIRVYSNKGNITLDGTTANAGKIFTSGAVGGMTAAEDFTLTLKNKTSLSLTDSSYANPSYSANSKFHGKIIVDGGSEIKSTNSKYVLFTPAGISVSGENSSMNLYAVMSKSAVSVDGGAEIVADIVKASDAFVGAGSTLTGKTSLTIENALTVASDASVSSKSISFEKLTITFTEDFSANTDVSFDLATIFGENAGVVLSALESGAGFTVSGKNGEFSASYKDIGGGTIHIDTQVIPEPATCAALFGGLALAFALARRRK